MRNVIKLFLSPSFRNINASQRLSKILNILLIWRCGICKSGFFTQSVYNDHMEAHKLANTESPVLIQEEEKKEEKK